VKKPEKEKLVYSVLEISVLLGINLAKAYELVRRSDFPAVNIGKRILIPKKTFYTWLDQAAKKD